jgi:hypothetical protein
MGRISRDARLCFIELWTIADDSGKLRAASRMLASLLFPYDDDAPELMDGWLAELEKEHCIVRYEVDGQHYIKVTNWQSHQKIDRPSPSRFPDIIEPSPIPRDNSTSPREPSLEDLGPRIEDLGMDQGSKEAAPVSFLPTLKPKSISRDGSARIELARTYWNTKAPKIGPPCMMLAITFRPEDTHDCLRVMTAYDDDKIFEAIDNYAAILASPEHEIGSPYRSFVGFIRGGVEKFVSDAMPFEAFKKPEAPDWVQAREEKKARGTLDDRPDAWDEQSAAAHEADLQESMSPEEKAAAMDEWAKEHPDSPVAKALARMTG